jgi:hypothetical protein
MDPPTGRSITADHPAQHATSWQHGRDSVGRVPFLLRVELPDVPGSLGQVATAIGEAGGDIEAIEIVEHRADGMAVDDVLLETAPGTMPDSSGTTHICTKCTGSLCVADPVSVHESFFSECRMPVPADIRCAKPG